MWTIKHLERCRKCQHWVIDDVCLGKHHGEFRGRWCDRFTELRILDDEIGEEWEWSGAFANKRNIATCSKCKTTDIDWIGYINGKNWEGNLYKCKNGHEIIQKIRGKRNERNKGEQQ